MANETMADHGGHAASTWLRTYYFTRFAVSAAWVALAFTIARNAPLLASAMLVAYPAWDAFANYLDANRSGGLARNRTQMLNLAVSALATVGVAVALGRGMNAVLAAFGLWATISGVFQLATGVRRWKAYGAQWAMILSGAQSALAGVFFVRMASGSGPVGILTVAPYAAFGAFYFLVSAVWLTVRSGRRNSDPAAA